MLGNGPNASSIPLDKLALRLGYRNIIVCSYEKLGGGYTLYIKQCLDGEWVAVEFCNMYGSL